MWTMKNKLLSILSLVSIVIMFSNCRATKREVFGTWSTAFETISFKKDDAFYCQYSYGDRHVEATGKWYISKGTVYLNFNDAQGQLFGDCNSAQVYNNLIFGMRMIRNRDCTGDPRTKPIFYGKVAQLSNSY